MKKLWTFVKTKFLTKKFLSFGIIGVVNTGIHLAVYWLCYNLAGFRTITLTFRLLEIGGNTATNLGAFLSNTVAFIVASVFSYFANVVFTFKPTRKSGTQFSFVMGFFVASLLVSNFLTWAFDEMIIHWFRADYDNHRWMTVMAPFLASALLIPIAYFALEYVFKKTDKKNGQNPEKTSLNDQNNVK